MGTCSSSAHGLKKSSQIRGYKAGFLKREAAGAASWVCRDSSGMPIDESASSAEVLSPLHAETLAPLEDDGEKKAANLAT